VVFQGHQVLVANKELQDTVALQAQVVLVVLVVNQE